MYLISRKSVSRYVHFYEDFPPLQLPMRLLFSHIRHSARSNFRNLRRLKFRGFFILGRREFLREGS